MDDREWKTFVTVVDEGNITRAAEKLFLSQPALSYRLRHMEKALGHSLLLRTAEGIALTAQGEIFYDYCKRMMQDQEALENAMNSASGKIQGTLKIASSINFADYELPAFIESLPRTIPRCSYSSKDCFQPSSGKNV